MLMCLLNRTLAPVAQERSVAATASPVTQMGDLEKLSMASTDAQSASKRLAIASARLAELFLRL